MKPKEYYQSNTKEQLIEIAIAQAQVIAIDRNYIRRQDAIIARLRGRNWFQRLFNL